MSCFQTTELLFFAENHRRFSLLTTDLYTILITDGWCTLRFQMQILSASNLERLQRSINCDAVQLEKYLVEGSPTWI